MTKRARQVLRRQIVGHRAGHVVEVGDAGDGAEFLLDVAHEQLDLLRRAAAGERAGIRCRGCAASRPRSIACLVLRQRRRASGRGGWRRGSASLAHRRGRPLRACVAGEERVALGRRQVAPVGPAAGQRQAAEPAASAAQQPERRSAPARVASRYSAGRRANQAQSARLRARQRRASGAARTRAPANGASAWAAGSSPGRRSRTCRRRWRRWAGGPALSTPIRPGVSTLPIGPGIDPAIGVPADRAIDRAMVHAGGAADAAQHVLELGAEHGRAAVVDQHDVVFLRPVEIARPPRRRCENVV